MKKLIIVIAILFSQNVFAATWWFNGILYGNVCRFGGYYTVYPAAYAQPVGTECIVRDRYNNFLFWGRVSNE